MNEPLNGAIRILNEFTDLFEFGENRDGFRERIKERMRRSSWRTNYVVKINKSNQIKLVTKELKQTRKTYCF
jgi:hypothetical protein